MYETISAFFIIQNFGLMQVIKLSILLCYIINLMDESMFLLYNLGTYSQINILCINESDTIFFSYI